MKQTKEEIVEELKHQIDLTKVLRKRLRVLEQTQAKKGADTPPDIITEIESITKEITRKESAIASLEEDAAEEGAPPDDSTVIQENVISSFLLLGVKARKSEQVVKLLSQAYGDIQEAAAVYSEVDIVIRLSATQSRLGEILVELSQSSIRIHDEEYNKDVLFEITSVQPLLIDGNVKQGTDQQECDLYKDVYAYVLIDVADGDGAKEEVLAELQDHEGIVYLAALKAKQGLIAKVKAPNKISFDNMIMTRIQEVPRVISTLSLIVINGMHIIR
jgi:DNA-binding Lrp family transcriptional regulator